jgi:hypothetical protein
MGLTAVRGKPGAWAGDGASEHWSQPPAKLGEEVVEDLAKITREVCPDIDDQRHRAAVVAMIKRRWSAAWQILDCDDPDGVQERWWAGYWRRRRLIDESLV